MEPPLDLRVTDDLFWRATLAAAMLDVALVVLLSWLIPGHQFRRMAKAIWGVSTLFWFLVWGWVMAQYWELAYSYIFPAWARWVAPPFYGLFFGGVGFGLWWIACRLACNPVSIFCLLGGFASLPGHSWAILGMGMLDRVPLLQKATPAAALIFGFFEFIVYWSVILALAALLRSAYEHLRSQSAGVSRSQLD